MKVLILGGTTEASAIARALVGDHRITQPCRWPGARARRCCRPSLHAVAVFGGIDGLAAYLRDHAVDVLVDATHPFAAQMSRHAQEAGAQAGVPCLAVRRPAWQRCPAIDGSTCPTWRPRPRLLATRRGAFS